MSGHACNAYCADGLHCDLVYTGLREVFTGTPSNHTLTADRWEREIAATYAARGRQVERVERAAEAPRWATSPMSNCSG